MKYKLICCEVFLREACIAIANSPQMVDPEFTPKGAHENPDSLRQVIQHKIHDAEKAGGYDAILLGYGLCGNSTAGLCSETIPLVIPRAHDCCTIFLGSREEFNKYFKDNLSCEWSSAGYMERGNSYLRETDTGKILGTDKSYQDFIDIYGEENARFIWDTLHPEKEDNKLIYIEMPETAHLGYLEKARRIAREQAKELCILKGDMRLIRKLANGEWGNDEFLIVPPGGCIKPVYDSEVIFTAKFY